MCLLALRGKRKKLIPKVLREVLRGGLRLVVLRNPERAKGKKTSPNVRAQVPTGVDSKIDLYLEERHAH